jgi:hypothetical protein
LKIAISILLDLLGVTIAFFTGYDLPLKGNLLYSDVLDWTVMFITQSCIIYYIYMTSIHVYIERCLEYLDR